MCNNGDDANKKGEGMGQMPQIPQMPQQQERPREPQQSGISEKKDLAQKINMDKPGNAGNMTAFGMPVKAKDKETASGGGFGGGGGFGSGQSGNFRDSGITNQGSTGASLQPKVDGASGGGGGLNSSGASRAPTSDTEKYAAKDAPGSQGFEIPGGGGGRPSFLGLNNKNDALSEAGLTPPGDASVPGGEALASDEAGPEGSAEEQAEAVADTESSVFNRVSGKIREYNRRRLL